ncbi:S-layer homology domain-containing protein [Paenibacillus sp. OSY-SE]|uniref:S-layer homology domain-containing protein n=1 Tax=Paenibacillus sp. OSY-SE TaxID=1196323 RepID=UPI0002DCD9E5|nr:S-layer homology domain-containing protein [Paenibacillus sp. OSY-SE]
MQDTNENSVHSSVIRGMRRFARYAALTTILAAGIYVCPFNAEPVSAAANTADASSGYTEDQLAGLALLNEVRVNAGVQPVRLHSAITKAATLHASYYNNNNIQPSLSAHKETPGMPGFTGKSVLERMKAAGWLPGSQGYSSGEVMHFKQKSSVKAIHGWLDTAYHREIILSPKYSEVGIALVDGTAVINMAGSYSTSVIEGGVSVYPHDKMTGVPVGFYGHEIPNPLDQFDVKFSGYIISATTEKPMAWHEATITDETGVTIPYHEELKSDTLFLYPKSVLQGFHTYTVSLAYQVEDSPATQRKAWSFTTGQGHRLLELSANYAEIVVNEGEEYPIQVIGNYDDGTSDSLASGVKFASSSPGNLTISSSGILKGIKAGDYTVTMSSEGVSSQVKVKVLPRLKTKAYPATSDPSKLTDIGGHKAESAVAWAVQSGIIAGSRDGSFQPDAEISEADFWTMLLRMYKVNIDAYAPAKKKHWADAAYIIADERNFPLNGLTSLSARDGKMTRLKAAEIISAADGVNFAGNNVVWYILGKDYAKGKTELSIEGYKPGDALTRGEAAQMLQYLQPKLKELRGRPANITPISVLPRLPEREVYVKPDTMEDRMMWAELQDDYMLAVEGKFAQLAGQQLTLMVQTGGSKPQQIQDVSVSVDSQGTFKVSAGPFQEDSLNLYLRTEGVYYWIPVNYKSMNASQYSENY